MPDMSSIHLNTRQLLRYHCSCYGNLVAVAMKYVVDAYYPKKHHAKYKVNTTQEEVVTKLMLPFPTDVTISTDIDRRIDCAKYK